MYASSREILARFEHEQRVIRAERRAPFLSELEREANRPAPRAERRRFPSRLLAVLSFRA